MRIYTFLEIPGGEIYYRRVYHFGTTLVKLVPFGYEFFIYIPLFPYQFTIRFDFGSRP